MSTKPTPSGRNSKQDWFECDANLSSKPEVMRIRRVTRCEIALIVGRLVMLWSLVDQHGDLLDESERPDQRPELDGIIPDYTVEDLIDQVGGDRAFWEAVISTGWLAESEMGLLIPGFDRRFSTNSKRRSGASRRKMRQRLREKGVLPDPKSREEEDERSETRGESERADGGKVQLELGLDAESRDGVTFVTRERDNRTGQDRTEQSPPPTPASLASDAAIGDGRSREEVEEIQKPKPGRQAEPKEFLEPPPDRATGDRGGTATRAKPRPKSAGYAPELELLRQRLLALDVTAPQVFPMALKACGAEHLEALIAHAESHAPIETPDGPLVAFRPGVIANRITQSGRAQLPARQGWEPDKDWALANRRLRERAMTAQVQARQLLEKIPIDQLEQRYGEKLAQEDQRALWSLILKRNAGLVQLDERERRRELLLMVAMGEIQEGVM